jgi:hypothetical protein
MEVDVVQVSTSLPLKHQLAKLVIATIVGFAATKLSEKGYDAALACYQRSKASTE